MNLQCTNEKCKYDFFDFDVSLPCCPCCGAIIQGNFQALDDRQRPLVYLKIKAFQDYVNKSKLMQKLLFYSVFVLLSIELILAFFTILSPNTIAFPGFATDPNGLWISSFLRRGFFIALIYLTHSHYESNSFFRLAMGPNLWKYHTRRGKVIVRISLTIIVLAMILIEIPAFYRWSIRGFGRAYGSLLIPIIQTVFYVLYLIWVVAEVLVYHWDDMKRRTMCEAMRAL